MRNPFVLTWSIQGWTHPFRRVSINSAPRCPRSVLRTNCRMRLPRRSPSLFCLAGGWRRSPNRYRPPVCPSRTMSSLQPRRPRLRNLIFYPDSYIFPREISAGEMVNELVRNSALHLTLDLKNGFEKQGLNVYQAVTLASMVQREAVHEEEQPLIASVYLNRLKIGMKLDADPTVQYAIGYNILQKTWWTNPLSLLDLQINSPYNTYIYAGLPPTPIANPGLSALRAVAFPEETEFYFFRAKCDGSGFHEFAETFDEHLENACP